MIRRLANYRHLRRNKIRNAWEYADMTGLMLKLIHGLGWLLIITGLALAYFGSVAEVKESAQRSVAEEVDEQQAVIRELLKIATACLSGGDRPVWIGDELWLCGSARTGIKR